MTATASVNDMDISILTVREFIKIISKWGKKLFQSGAASTNFYFKVGQASFQSGAETVISKWVNVYLKVGQKLF